MKKSAFVAALSACVLTACQTIGLDASGAAAAWKDYVCKVVLAKHCVKVSIANGQISVDKPTVYVDADNNRKWILWWIETDGYIFVNETGNRPVTFKSSTNGQFDPDNLNKCYHFGNALIPPNGKVFVCVDEATVKGPFLYTLKVKEVSPAPAVPALDPSIVNG
jgi:hypothetical protein